MEFTITQSQAILLDLLTDPQLAEMREANKDNLEVVKAIEDRQIAKAQAIATKQALDAFTTALNSLEVLPAPEGVHNIYRAYRKDFRPIHKDEVKAVLKANPNLDEAEVSNRMVELDTYSWSPWTINKAMTESKVATTSKLSTRKLAVTVNKRDGNELTPIGNFRTSKECCNHLGYDTKGDSARRVLEAHKYVVDDYEGSDFLIPEV